MKVSFYLPQRDTNNEFSINYKGDVYTGLFDRHYVGNLFTNTKGIVSSSI